MSTAVTELPARLVRAGHALRVVRLPGTSAQDWQRVRDRLDTLGLVAGAAGVAVPATHAAAVLDVVAGDVEVSASARQLVDRHAGRRLALRQAVGAPAPACADEAALAVELSACGFARALRPFQARDVSRLVDIGSGGNFAVPGAGKTTMTYAQFALLRGRGLVDAMAVVAPWSAHEAWRTEAHDCFADGRAPQVATLPGSLSPDVDVALLAYPRLLDAAAVAELRSFAWHRRLLLVFDEAHRVKRGRDGAWGEVAADLAVDVPYRMVLTGTPVPNGMADLSAQLDLAWPGFGEELAVGGMSTSRDRIFVRTTKAELGLPPLELRHVDVPLDDDHRDVYAAMAGDAAALVHDPAAAADLAELGRAVLRLVAAATDVSTVAPGAVARPGAKLRAAAELVRTNAAAGRKTLVWASFRRHVATLAGLLAELEPAVVTGDVPTDDPSAATDRERELARFRTDPACHVLIATPQTLGEGISLHRVCSDQVHLDRTFNAGLWLQSLDRTHRLGMDADARPTATVLVADDTLDVRVRELVDGKVARMAAVLDDASLASLTPPMDAADRLADLTVDDAVALLRRNGRTGGQAS